MPDPLEPARSRKVIRNAAWLVGWDEPAQSHRYRRDVDLAIEGDTIAAIGPTGPADHDDVIEIDGRGFAILLGFVDIHSHPSSEPMLKGLTDEVGSHQLYMSSLYVAALRPSASPSISPPASSSTSRSFHRKVGTVPAETASATRSTPG